jgi:hypothetical protein
VSDTTSQLNRRANGDHRESNILRWISFTHPLVGSSQRLHFPGVLDLDCGCCLLLYQCVEHRLPTFSEFPRYNPCVQALEATKTDLCTQYSTILEMLTESERLSMPLQAISSMLISTLLTLRYFCMFYKVRNSKSV